MADKKYEDYVSEVKGPGKFEGEPPYVPYMWEGVIDMGGGDESIIVDAVTVDVIIVTKSDKAMFPNELHDTDVVLLWEDDNGFVHHRDFHSEEAYDSWKDRAGITDR